jgi:hypothetical protein
MPCHQEQSTDSEDGSSPKNGALAEHLTDSAECQSSEDSTEFEEHRETGNNCHPFVIVDVAHAHGQERRVEE